MLDGQICFEAVRTDFAEFAKQAFKARNSSYSKFHKMDALSRLGMLAAEYILSDEDTDDLALVLANRSGSLDTDMRHHETIKEESNFYPSPATFVYTLANICGGEISIRHGLQTENIFFVSEHYPVDTISVYADYLLASKKAKRVLCGWIEFFQEKYEAVLYIVAQHGEKPHVKENIQGLFTAEDDIV